jgi:hypothetical protein
MYSEGCWSSEAAIDPLPKELALDKRGRPGVPRAPPVPLAPSGLFEPCGLYAWKPKLGLDEDPGRFNGFEDSAKLPFATGFPWVPYPTPAPLPPRSIECSE